MTELEQAGAEYRAAYERLRDARSRGDGSAAALMDARCNETLRALNAAAEKADERWYKTKTAQEADE